MYARVSGVVLAERLPGCWTLRERKTRKVERAPSQNLRRTRAGRRVGIGRESRAGLLMAV